MVRPKDKILKQPAVGPVNHIPCDSCGASCNTRGDTEKLLKAQVWSIEDLHVALPPLRWLEREIREAMEQPSLNKDVGRYNLPFEVASQGGQHRGPTTNPDPCYQGPNAIWSFFRVIKSPVGDESFKVSFRYFYPEFTSLKVTLDITWIDESTPKHYYYYYYYYHHHHHHHYHHHYYYYCKKY